MTLWCRSSGTIRKQGKRRFMKLLCNFVVFRFLQIRSGIITKWDQAPVGHVYYWPAGLPGVLAVRASFWLLPQFSGYVVLHTRASIRARVTRLYRNIGILSLSLLHTSLDRNRYLGSMLTTMAISSLNTTNSTQLLFNTNSVSQFQGVPS